MVFLMYKNIEFGGEYLMCLHICEESHIGLCMFFRKPRVTSLDSIESGN